MNAGELLKSGRVHDVDIDIKGYFDSIPHDRLMELVEKHIADGRVLGMIEGFLKAGVMEGKGTGEAGTIADGRIDTLTPLGSSAWKRLKHGNKPASNKEQNADWKAGCGKSARPVWWEGRELHPAPTPDRYW